MHRPQEIHASVFVPQVIEEGPAVIGDGIALSQSDSKVESLQQQGTLFISSQGKSHWVFIPDSQLDLVALKKTSNWKSALLRENALGHAQRWFAGFVWTHA